MKNHWYIKDYRGNIIIDRFTKRLSRAPKGKKILTDWIPTKGLVTKKNMFENESIEEG